MAPRIFLLEDMPTSAALMKEIAQKEGWDIHWVDRVKEVFPALQQFRPDIFLLDVSLPDGTGYEACKIIRKDDSLAKVPVVFLTSRNDVSSRLQGFEAGGQDYLAKPFDARELVARICAHLAIKRGTDALMREREELLIRERLRQDMLDMVMHDLRAPLSAVKGTLEWVRESGLITKENYVVLLRNAETATDCALFMVNDMLDVSTGGLKAHPTEVDLQMLVAGVKALFISVIEARHFMFEVDNPPENPKVTMDNMILLRILVNLMSNAVKFSPSRSAIGIKIRHRDGILRMEVWDTGPGVPDHEKIKIFEKLYRADTATTKSTPGCGIGLSFCKLAADTLGGKIWVENNQPAGSRFIVEVPAAIA